MQIYLHYIFNKYEVNLNFIKNTKRIGLAKRMECAPACRRCREERVHFLQTAPASRSALHTFHETQ
jgi:hypothetical protein